MERPIHQTSQVLAVAEGIAEAGLFALDLEFVSESRYVPELGLVQVAWGDPERPQVAAIDPLAVDPRPVLDLVAREGVVTVLHSAQGDLSLIGDRFAIEARGLVDSQIAAAFVGVGDQIGYTGLVESLLQVSLDKGAQFTDWLRRPLSDEQLRYALDDVRYLLPAWKELEGRLKKRGRLAWVKEESARLARQAARRPPPEEAYRKVKGRQKLRPRQLGALREVASWREKEALTSNLPPSWLIQDRVLVELARRPPRDLKQLAASRGIKSRTLDRHGREILEALRRGAEGPEETEPRQRPLPQHAQTWSTVLSGLVEARCREAGIAPRFVGTRGDHERLVRWWVEGDRGQEPDLGLLQGWRRELAGQAVLDWLEGQIAVAIDPSSDSGIVLVSRERVE
jgi:ribonuclease D